MTINPNNPRRTRPPMVTPLTRPMPAPAPKGRRRNGAAVAGAIIVSVVGLALGYTVGTVTSSTPASCMEALERSDELNVLSEEYSVLVNTAIEAAFSFDEDQVAAAEAEGEDFAVRYETALDAYESAAADCRAQDGDVR